jgi:hypothetical protein
MKSQLLLAFATLALSSLSATSASADMVRHANLDLCLTRNSDNTASFYQCLAGNPNQDFLRTKEDILHRPTGLCIGRANSGRKAQNFDRAILQDCNQSPSILGGGGEFYLWGNTNFALDIFGNKPQNGSNAHWYAKGNSTQQLRFVPNLQASQPVSRPATPQAVPQPQAQPKPSCPSKGQYLGLNWDLHEAIIAAVPLNTLRSNHPGHAFFGIVKTYEGRYTDGNCGTFKQIKREFTTVSSVGYNAPVLVTDNAKDDQEPTSSAPNSTLGDIHQLRRYYNEGLPKKIGSGFSFHRVAISSNEYTRFMLTNLNQLTGCREYDSVTNINLFSDSTGFCHCGDSAARLFGHFTGDWSFNQGVINSTAPHSIYHKIIAR